jgi:hypothetical protein
VLLRTKYFSDGIQIYPHLKEVSALFETPLAPAPWEKAAVSRDALR